MEFPLHATIAVQSVKIPQINLWYLCRALDPVGSGKALVTAEQLDSFSKHRTTLWRWLNDGRFFRSWKRVETGIVIYYRSLINVCLDLNIRSLGGVAKTDTIENLAEQGALIEAIKVQRQSKWLLKKEYRLVMDELGLFDEQGRPKESLDIDFSAKSLELPDDHKVVKFKVEPYSFNKRALVHLHSQRYFGVSQKGLAKRLDLDICTVRKLLSSASKVQVMINTSWWWYNKAKFEASENMGQWQEGGFFFHPKRGELPVKLNPYIYYPIYDLTSKRFQRSKLNKAWLFKDAQAVRTPLNPRSII